MPRPRAPRDSGQMMASFVMFLCLCLLSFLVVFLLPVGAATNEATRAQTAADAAALAAAQAVRTHWVDVETAPAGLFHPAGGNPRGRALGVGLGRTGQGAASDYARLNDAEVVGYSAALGRGRVTVDVENDWTSLEGDNASLGPARRSATAEMDADFRGCRWSPRDPLLPTLEGTPPGPPTFQARLSCGRWSADYEVVNSAVALFPVQGYAPGGRGRDELYDLLEPRLVD